MQEGLKKINISHTKKCQWIAPERTGSRKVASILKYFGFVQGGHSVETHMTHFVFFDDNYSDYKIICNARNPYSRTLAVFRNIYTKETRNGSKEQFRKYVFEDLKKGKSLDIVRNPLMTKKIDYLVRLENMTEDLKKIPFITEKLTTTQIENMTFHGKPLFEWEDFYDQEMKDEVYSYTKHLFELWGYEK